MLPSLTPRSPSPSTPRSAATEDGLDGEGATELQQRCRIEILLLRDWEVHPVSSLLEALARQHTDRNIDERDEQQQNQGAGPGLAMPILIRRNRIIEYLQG